ncbi:hypothetical protein FRC98_07150 [Lujinxingia vulgaris]|uniref:Lipoprotein n=1 Tax=Lujinxingia vulgaris TaxID=2600176 RepID=A0A5C6X6N6_9DELT|nr:hypothetical protein [Lujinxingia vulgaris]TXD37463.1 hypothetical protein FRC98_07150 [Lujinxingia vulgaris]
MKWKTLLLMMCVGLACACGEAEGDDTTNDQPDAGNEEQDTSDDENPANAGTFDLTVQETNIGTPPAVELEGQTNEASAEFGASVSEGRLRVVASDDRFKLTIGIDTSENNTLPGEKATTSGFAVDTFAILEIDNIYHGMQGGGSVNFDACPQEVGDRVTLTLNEVRLASDTSDHIKNTSGTVEVEVYESDGSLYCE